MLNSPQIEFRDESALFTSLRLFDRPREEKKGENSLVRFGVIRRHPSQFYVSDASRLTIEI